jgi:hypothetical protein
VQQPPQDEGVEMVNVSVMITYIDGGNNQGRFRWPCTITPEAALRTVLEQLPDNELRDELVRIQFSQVARNQRIKWMDETPNGQYNVNQDLLEQPYYL